MGNLISLDKLKIGFRSLRASSTFILFLVLSISILVIFSPIFVFDQPFLLLNDQAVQYNFFYREWIRLVNNFIETGWFPFYSWYKFLGSDYYSSALYYTNGDVFLPLILFIKDVDLALFVKSVLLVYISAFTFKYYLLKLDISKKHILIIVPFVYAVNGMVGLYYGNYMFHQFYAFLPLLFAGTELYLKQRRILLFVSSVSLLFLQSFYFMFPTSLFLVIYVVFTNLLRSKKVFQVDFVLESFKLIGLYLLGVGLVAFLVYPSIIYTLQSPRVGNFIIDQVTWPIRTWLGIFASFSSGPFPNLTSIPNIFQVGEDGHASWYSFYISAYLFAVLIAFLGNRNSKNRKAFIFSFFSLFMILMFFPVNQVFHGLSEPSMRMTFLFTFFALTTTAYALEHSDDMLSSIKRFYHLYLIGLMIVLLLAFFLGYIELGTHNFHFLVILASMLFGLIFFKLVEVNRKFLLLLIVVEVSINLSLYVYYANKVFYKHNDNLIYDYVEYYHNSDPAKLFRTYVDPIHFLPSTELNLNQSLVYNYMSTSTYDSFYEPHLRDFLDLNGIYGHIIHLDNPDVLKLLGVKYYIVFSEEEIPADVEYALANRINHLTAYQDLNPLPIGFTYSKFQLIDDVASNYTDWLDKLLIYADDIEDIVDVDFSERAYFDVYEKYPNGLFGTIELNSKQVLFLSIPYNEGWQITVNNEVVKPIKVHGGFIGILLDEGYHEIGMKFQPVGLKLGVFVSGASALIIVFIYVLNILRIRWKKDSK